MDLNCRTILRWANIALLVLYPLSWYAPLMRAGLLPLFGLTEISVLTGVLSLWDSDKALAVFVILFALVAPLGKTLALCLIQFGYLRRSVLAWVGILGKLAMAEVFLIAIYITVVKGIGLAHIETAWGLYLFTFCSITSLLIGLLESRQTPWPTPRDPA